MTDDLTTVKPLHDLYCRLSGRQVDMLMSCIFAWNKFRSHGWGEPELKLVIPLVHKKIKAGQKWSSALSMRNLIENEDNFNELLSEARSEARIPKVNHGLNQVLRATGRPTKHEEVKVTVRSAADIIAAEKAFEQFRQLKQTL